MLFLVDGDISNINTLPLEMSLAAPLRTAKTLWPFMHQCEHSDWMWRNVVFKSVGAVSQSTLGLQMKISNAATLHCRFHRRHPGLL